MSVKSGYRPRGRKDINHKAVKEVFLRAGWRVLDTSAVGRGAPDLMVQAPGWEAYQIRLIEIKRDARAKLKPAQVNFAAHGWPVTVICSVNEALKFIGVVG